MPNGVKRTIVVTIKWATDSGAARSIPAVMASLLMAAMNGLGVGEDGVSQSGRLLAKWGSEFGAGLFNYLRGVSVAPVGSVYVAEWVNHRI